MEYLTEPITSYKLFSIVENNNNGNKKTLAPLFWADFPDSWEGGTINDWKNDPSSWAEARCYCKRFNSCIYIYDACKDGKAYQHIIRGIDDYNNKAYCGFYSKKSLKDIEFNLRDGRFENSIVIARIEIAGYVIEGEDGYRSTKARIIDLVGPVSNRAYMFSIGTIKPIAPFSKWDYHIINNPFPNYPIFIKDLRNQFENGVYLT